MTQLCDLVANVLGVPVDRVTDAVGPATVGQWTSLKHLQLVLALQEAYSVTLSPREIRSVRSVGDLRAALRNRGIEE